MTVRRQTPNRRTLYRKCQTCGREITTTADTPFVRQLANIDGKKQKTCYFCSASCKERSYTHLFDGQADARKRARDAHRDRKQQNASYYARNAEKAREKARARYHADPEGCRASNEFNKRKRALFKAEKEAEAALRKENVKC